MSETSVTKPTIVAAQCERAWFPAWLRKVTGVLIATLAAGAFVAAEAQSTSYFPHLAVGASWQTTITYINYSPQEVVCQTEFLSDHGSPLMVSFAGLGTVDSRSDVLPSGGSVHQETNVDLSAPLAPGWARATCTGPVKASLLFRRYNSEGVPVAEAAVNAATVPATRFVTFAEQGEGQFGTGVAYANPSSTAAHVTFTVRDAAGVTLASVDRTLLPNGHDAQTMAGLFGLSSFTGSLEITSTEPIVTLALNFEAAPVFSSLPPGEQDAAAQEETNYYFPHLAVGASWQTTITYINDSPQEVTCRTDFLSDHGSPLLVSFAGQGTVDNRTDVLPPGGSVNEETNVELSAPLLPGWARATCSGPVKASLLFRRYNSEGVPTAEAAVNAAAVPTTRFVTFAEQQEGKAGTGVAYANPSDTAALVTFTAKDAAGLTLARVDRTLLPNGHDAQTMAGLFGLSSFTGSLEITSTEPIVTLALNFEAAPVFSSLPPGEIVDPPDIPATEGPDLVVQAPWVSDSNPNAGESFVFTATVRNQGSSASTLTTLRYYRSTDTLISTSDTEVGTGAVSDLSASGASDQSIGLTAPVTAGTYYYGACVDPVSGEADPGNNCSSAVSVRVGDVGNPIIPQGVLFSEDFSSGTFDKWTTVGKGPVGGSPNPGSLSIVDGVLRMEATAGGNYDIRASKEIRVERRYSEYRLSFDWKAVTRETPYGLDGVRLLFYDAEDRLIGGLVAVNSGQTRRGGDVLDHVRPTTLSNDQHTGIGKLAETFDWQRVTLDTSMIPGMDPRDVARLELRASVYNDAGSGGEMHFDNFELRGTGSNAPAGHTERFDSVTYEGSGTLGNGDRMRAGDLIIEVPDRTLVDDLRIAVRERTLPAALPIGAGQIADPVEISITDEDQDKLNAPLVMTMTYPVRNAGGVDEVTVMHFEADQRRWLPATVVSHDAQKRQVVFNSRSFSIFVAVDFTESEIPESWPPPGTAGFDPAKHGFSISNRGYEYHTPGGNCYGMSAYAIYNFLHEKRDIYNLWDDTTQSTVATLAHLSQPIWSVNNLDRLGTGPGGEHHRR